MQLMDFSLMPAPLAVAELDYEAIRTEMIAKARDIDGWNAELESDPVVKLLEILAYRELLLRARVNDAVKATTLASAAQTDLDYLGANVNTPRLAGELDEAYRYRIQLAFNRMAAAGPAEYYRQHALSVSADTLDVGVHSPAAGEVVVTVLASVAQDESAISAEQARIGIALFGVHPNGAKRWTLMPNDHPNMVQIRQLLNSDSVRPLTDSVQVRAPHIVTTHIKAELWAYPGPDTVVLLAQARQSMSDYLQRVRRIGYDLTRSGILSALSVSGVQNVILSTPNEDVVIHNGELIAAVEVSLTIKGVAV